MTVPATDVVSEAELVERFSRGLAGLADDAGLIRRGRHLSAEFLVGFGSTRCLVTVTEGRVGLPRVDVPLMRPTGFSVLGTPRAWDRLWQPVPTPGWHDLLALCKRGEMELQGDLRIVLRHLQYLKDVLAAPRRLASTEREG